LKRSKHLPTLLGAIVLGTLAAPASASAGGKEKPLFDLSQKDGWYVWGTPVLDASGNLFAAGELGGKRGGGALFELSPGQSGTWTISVLHDFGKHFDFNHPKDGEQPTGALVFDAAGNLYGTTFFGGRYANTETGGGIVYRLSPGGAGAWTETVLHDFANGQDAAEPNGGVIFDAAGNLYGTSELGGYFSGNCQTFGCGTVFEMSPDGKGGWTETVLHAFGSGQDGLSPYGGLVSDAAGNLYGTTLYGGAYGGGSVFELSPGTNGQWTESVVYSFCARTACADGAFPFDAPILDSAGNLYGTTDSGGTYSDCVGGSTCGTVFELSPGNGQWTETVLHSFDATDGDVPIASLVFDAAGNLFGTTSSGGGTACSMGCGTVFELKPEGGGAWTAKTLHIFQNRKDGANPESGLVFNSSGTAYSVSSQGPGKACGGLGCGAVFSVQP
jgi:uncharacterized repeat protein (TIGR03803 family)